MVGLLVTHKERNCMLLNYMNVMAGWVVNYCTRVGRRRRECMYSVPENLFLNVDREFRYCEGDVLV